MKFPIWGVGNDRVSLKVHAFGGMICECRIQLGNGTIVEPFYIAPWVQSGETSAGPFELVSQLRSEFFGLPFGTEYPQSSTSVPEWEASLSTTNDTDDTDLIHLHGYGANHSWRLVSQQSDQLLIEIEYPLESSVFRLSRRYRLVGGDVHGIQIETTVEVRRPCSFPFGIHPNFRMPADGSFLRIDPGRFEVGFTHPAMDGACTSRAQPWTKFSKLSDVLARDEAKLDLSQLPLAKPSDEIVLLCGSEGRVLLTDQAHSVLYSVNWNRLLIPNLMLWISNGGRQSRPWNGNNFCIGIEPVVSAFDLGTYASRSPNPLANQGVETVRRFLPQKPETFSIEIAAQSI